MANGSGSVLNPSQVRYLQVTLHEADRLLSEIEHVLNSSGSKSPFPKYIANFTPVQRKTIDDYISRIRARLVRALEGQHIEPEPPSIPATRAIHSSLTFVEIAIEELRPRYMQGYGEVPPVAAAELNGIAGELSTLVQQLDRYVTHAGEDLKARLAQLEPAGYEVELLKELERIVSEHGLVEFRSTLAMVLSRLEDTSFEIAFLGRVSSGKSSLLNAVLETDALPVGVTPITAIPTRIVYGDSPTFSVWFPGRNPEQYDIDRLGEFASERHNSGNTKDVSRILVQLPSPWLKNGIAFVDTPGLGSLAIAGATATMAYLPRCDLGIVFVDAGGALANSDLQTIDALYQAGIPAQVLLSKADLLAPDDLESVRKYTEEQLRSQLNLELPVYPVSTVGGHREFLSRWFNERIVPLFGRRQELRTSSIRRKLGGLGEAVRLALRSRLDRPSKDVSRARNEYRDIDAQLREATAWIEETHTTAKGVIDSIDTNQTAIFLRAAERLLTVRAEVDIAEADTAAEIRQAAWQQMQEQLATLRQALESLAASLERQLDAAAALLGTPNRPSQQEFHMLVREMPILDLDFLEVSVKPVLLARVLSKHFQVKTLARRIEKRAKPQLSNAYVTYSRLLRAWCDSVLTHMRRRFAAYADTYRAQAEGNADGLAVSSEARRAVELDLELLAALLPVDSAFEPVRQAN